MNDEYYEDELKQEKSPAIHGRNTLALDNDDPSRGQFLRNPPLITEEEDDPVSQFEKIGASAQVPAANQNPVLQQVETDREMAEFSNPGAIETGMNESATAAGMGALGGWRGLGRAALRNPLIMFPKRAARSVTNLGKGLWKLGKRGVSAIGRGLKKLFGSSPAAPAAQPPGVADGEGKVEEEAKVEEKEPPPPSISVDATSAYGKHMMGKSDLRQAMKDPAQAPAQDMAAPEGYNQTTFGNSQSIAHRMKTGQAVTDEERAYLRLMYAKANEITEKSQAASPENPSAFPFSQRTQADQEDTGLAKTGHALTAIGGAINDREEVRPEDGAGATAWDVLNAGANLGKAGMKQVDKLAKKAGFDDEKVLGSAGKAYAEVGKAAQFTYGFVGKDAAKLYDNTHPGPDGHAGHAGKDLTKELDPYLNIKNFDRIAQVAVDVPGTAGGHGANLQYSKNVNALSLGKFVEHPATIMQAAGTGMTEAYGKPFEKMHKKRADLLERQFATTVMRRMLQADRANKDGLIDEYVDEDRRGVEAFPNARAGLLQSVAGEASAAMKLGKEAQQAGYASNFGQDMNTTAMLNDKKHQRQYGGTFNKLMKERNDIRLRSDASKLDEEVKSDLTGERADEQEKERKVLAARAIQQFGIRTAYRRKKAVEAEAKRKLESLKAQDADELQQKADAVTTDKLKDAAELQWTDRATREDGADKEQWRGLWNERDPMAREDAKAAIAETTRMRENADVSDDDQLATVGDETGDDRGLVQGRSVRRREGLGRAAAGLGQGVGKTLSTVGGVMAFDGGENDLKAGNLKTSAAKAAMSEVWQNFGTGGLAKVPVVGDYAKTVGLGVYTPLGEGMKKIGGALEEASFGKENRDRLFNQHWGLESPNATEETRDTRAQLREEERGIADRIQGAGEDNGLKADFFAKSQRLRELQNEGNADADTLRDAKGAVDEARERVFASIRELRDVEGKLGYSRRRQLARTGLVMPGRAEADFNQPQTPLTEEQIEAHRERLGASGMAPLSAALPKKLMVYKSKAGGKDKADEQPAVVPQSGHDGDDDDANLPGSGRGHEGGDGDSKSDVSGTDENLPNGVSQLFDPNADFSPQPVAKEETKEVDIDEKYAHIFASDREVEKYLFPDTPKQNQRRS